MIDRGFQAVIVCQASTHGKHFTLKRDRVARKWIEGVRYNLELIQDWAHNCHDPIAHQRAIQIYQASLLSNQGLKRSHHG